MATVRPWLSATELGTLRGRRRGCRHRWGGGSDGDLHGRVDLEGMRTKGVTPGAEFRGPVVVTVAPCWPLWERGRSPGLAGPRGVGAAGKPGATGDAPSAGQCGGPRSKPFPAPATHVLPSSFLLSRFRVGAWFVFLFAHFFRPRLLISGHCQIKRKKKTPKENSQLSEMPTGSVLCRGCEAQLLGKPPFWADAVYLLENIAFLWCDPFHSVQDAAAPPCAGRKGRARAGSLAAAAGAGARGGRSGLSLQGVCLCFNRTEPPELTELVHRSLFCCQQRSGWAARSRCTVVLSGCCSRCPGGPPPL